MCILNSLSLIKEYTTGPVLLWGRWVQDWLVERNVIDIFFLMNKDFFYDVGGSDTRVDHKTIHISHINGI